MANNYRLSFKKQFDSADQAFFLPVNPDKLPTVTETSNTDYNVLGIGPIMVPRIPELKKITISSYFPGRIDNLTLTADNFREPEFYIDFFDSAMLNKEIISYVPIRIYENNVQYMIQDNTSMDYLVTNFQYEERGGETGDFYYDLELTEYKNYSPLQISLTGDTDSETGAAVATTQNTRSIPKGQLYVGAKVTLNGAYYYSSYGDEPHSNSSGRTCIISRIENTDDTRPYPVHVKTENGGALGWVKREALQVVSDS